MISLARLALPLLGFLAVALAGCDMADPDRARPDTFVPPEVGLFSALDPSRHYGGLLPITVTEDLAPFPIEFASAYVGGGRAGGCGPAPCTLHVQTDRFPDGPNDVALVLHQTDGPDPNLGLLNLVGAGALILTDTLVFNQSPPTPPRIDSVSWMAEGAEVHWSSPAGTNRNARSITLFHALDDDFSFDHAGEADAAEGFILDTEAERLLGFRARYVVGVWNGRSDGPSFDDREVAFSDTVSSSWSPFFTGAPSCSPALPLVAHAPGTDRLLLLCDDTLWSGSISERRFTSSAPAPDLTGPSAGAQRYLALRSDGTPSYLIETRWESQQYVTLATVDPMSLAVGAPVDVELPVANAFVEHAVASENGVVYLVSLRAGRVFVADAVTGAVTDSFGISPSLTGGGTYVGVEVFVTPDGRRLIRAGWDVIQSVDLTQSPPRVTASHAIGGESHFALDGAGHLYVAGHRSHTVEVLDAASLEPLHKFTAAEPGSFGIGGVWGGSEGVYVEADPTAPGGGVASLTGYTPAGQRFGTWPSAAYVQSLFFGESALDVALSINGGFASLPPSP
jgi:hypothetical protein